MLDKEEKKLKSANVGDSLYIIARYSKEHNKFNLFFKSEEQSHFFNCPFQLGTSGDNATECTKTETHDISNLDVVIVASDG